MQKLIMIKASRYHLKIIKSHCAPVFLGCARHESIIPCLRIVLQKRLFLSGANSMDSPCFEV